MRFLLKTAAIGLLCFLPSSSPARSSLALEVDLRGQRCSDCPVSVEIDFQEFLRSQKESGILDEDTVEVFAGFPPSRVPHRLEPFYGLTRMTLHFTVPNEHQTNFTVYFDTLKSHRRRSHPYHGMVGDGDRFSENFGRREVNASHFDCFVDFDGDGDLDLFKGGVEPYVYCWENVDGTRFKFRGRLTTDGHLFTLPCSSANRSWVTVAFHDVDGDGDQDFLPSFGDGPDAGRIVFYRNTTPHHGAPPRFERVGPLQTVSGQLLAGGPQAGGWFPSVTFVHDWDGDGQGPDALVGSKHRCWLYRRVGEDALVFSEPITLQAAGREIELVNPRFDCADIDNDGDLDLFAGTQPGAVHFFKNIGTRSEPRFAEGSVIAWSGKYLIGDAHSGVKVADFDADGRLDVLSGRFWERADLNEPGAPRDFGGLWKNTGKPGAPQFTRTTRGASYTEQFQPCDAVRQNCVRAVDWDDDGHLDLLAGDTDGFIWFFRNLSRDKPKVSSGKPSAAGSAFSVFAAPEKLAAGGRELSVTGTGGHARFDVADWDNDGRKDIVVADGSGTVMLFLNQGSRRRPRLALGVRVVAGGQSVQLSGRASVLICDWNNDSRKDLVLADDKGYYFCRNTGTDEAPVLSAATSVMFSGKRVRYVRPNLGAFVDWDGDGKRDFIGCHFENSIRFYRNIGSGARGEEPVFADPEGVVVLEGESPQMISGADVVDWNGDGDLDLLTGQGHGGSGLRFFERDWLEQSRHEHSDEPRVRR